MQLGDVFTLGDHKLMYGDATNPAHVNKLLGDDKPVLLLTDPPYCAGRTEASKVAGSIGTTQKNVKILNDQLSSRGYQSLIKSVLQLSPCLYNYIFTDWRMWVYLFDAVESCGYSPRSQIVWDKTCMALGQGWRAQHELIMFAVGATYKFDSKKSKGNVLQCKRTGNKNHPTEKPVELIKNLLDVFSDDVATVYDPFAGSGTTLLACEELGLKSWSMERDPKHVATAIKRYNNLIV